MPMSNRNMLFSFLLCTFAGISTLIGYLFIYIEKNKNEMISKSLGFASGVMITISIIDLIPNSFLLISRDYNKLNVVFLILTSLLVGITLSSIINKKIEKHSINGLKLYKLGIISMLVIIIHNIPEGIATFITTTNNIKLGITLAIAIALHNIPEGITISIPIYYSTNNKLKAFTYTFFSSISEPLGAILAFLFLSKYINNIILGLIYSFIAGMMLNIGINELYKESINYNKQYTIIYIILGSFIMILNHIIF